MNPLTNIFHLLSHSRPTFPIAGILLLFLDRTDAHWFITFQFFLTKLFIMVWPERYLSKTKIEWHNVPSHSLPVRDIVRIIITGLQNLILSVFSSTVYYDISYMPATSKYTLFFDHITYYSGSVFFKNMTPPAPLSAIKILAKLKVSGER